MRRLAELAQPFLRGTACDLSQGPPLAQVVALLKERANTIEELADAAVYFYRALEPSEELRAAALHRGRPARAADLRGAAGEDRMEACSASATASRRSWPRTS